MTSSKYNSNVFVNCPFDDQYKPIRDAILFAIIDCGFIPRSALEEDDSGNVRFDKIKKLIAESKFGVHDISRTELDDEHDLPRFNMPLELGVFIGAKKFGNSSHVKKNTLILDSEQYRYQIFISDIAGQDIRSHGCDPSEAIVQVRNWLNSASGRTTIPGGAAINRRFNKFHRELPNICRELELNVNEVTYNDYCNFVADWLKLQN